MTQLQHIELQAAKAKYNHELTDGNEYEINCAEDLVKTLEALYA